MKSQKQLLHNIKDALSYEIRGAKLIHSYQPGFFISTILKTIFSSVYPFVNVYLSAQIICEITSNRNPNTLWKWISLTLIINLLLKFTEYTTSRWYSYNFETFYNHGLTKVYSDKLQQMDFADVDKQETHETLAKIQQYARSFGWGLLYVGRLFQGLLTLLISIISTLALCWELFTSPVSSTAGKLTLLNHPLFTLGIFVLFLFTAYLSPMLTSKANQSFAEYAEAGRIGNLIFSFYGNNCSDSERALDMRIYNQQEVCEYYATTDTTFSIGGTYHKLCKGKMGLLHTASGMVSQIFIGVIYLYVCLKAYAGVFPVGSITQYIGAFATLFSSLRNAIACIGQAMTNTEFLKMTFEFLDKPNEMYQGSLTTEKRCDRQYEVEFKDVSFKYPGANTWALRNVNMKFTVGSRLAVVGMNGSGKTTFIKLLCRLYDPTEGEILLNGINIRKYNYADYISIFSVVFQDFQLLSLPLGQNVAASTSYDANRVLDCLKKAGFEEKLAEMPLGLETYLYKDFKEDGVSVSGGEAQKIAIARALYKDAAFIILDEPTAALDPIAEAEIYSKFNDIAGDKTAIYISHRLSSCRFCDDILVFHEGNVIQQGSHDKLVADITGKYYELWNAQAQYYV